MDMFFFVLLNCGFLGNRRVKSLPVLVKTLGLVKLRKWNAAIPLFAFL